jgi:hypothetical protein
MEKSEALRKALTHLGVSFLPANWFEHIEADLAVDGWYIAPIRQTGPTIPKRRTDPRTSHLAEPSTWRAGTQRHLLLRAFSHAPNNGMTDEEAMEWGSGVPPTSEYAKRCSELRQAGLIIDTGNDRKGNSGLDRIVSKITEAGIATVRRLDS